MTVFSCLLDIWINLNARKKKFQRKKKNHNKLKNPKKRENPRRKRKFKRESVTMAQMVNALTVSMKVIKVKKNT